MTIDRIDGPGPDFIPDPLEGKQIQQKPQVEQAGLGDLLDRIESGGPPPQAVAAMPMMFTAVPMSISTEHHLPNVDQMPWLDQGSANACGTTSLAMILSYLLGRPVTKDEIDSAIRRWDTFSSPNDLLEFARGLGVAAEGYNNGTWEEVKGMIDKGYPVQAMIQADYTYPDGSSVSGQHYVAITGYGTDPTTGEEYVLFHDPNLGDDPSTPNVNEGQEMRLPLSEFKKMWDNVGFGFHNYFMAFGPPGADLPPGRNDGVEGVLGTLDGVTNITNGLSRIFEPDSVGGFFHGIFEVPGGIIQTIGCGVGGAISLGGQWLNGVVEDVPVLENIVQPFGDIVDGIGSAVGDIFNGFGEAFDSVGGAFEDLFDGDVGGFFGGLWDGITDIGGGIVDAVGDFFSGVGDAISDFFSGW